jgi:hypothetical protein
MIILQRLLLILSSYFTENVTVSIHSENHMKSFSTFCVRNAQFFLALQWLMVHEANTRTLFFGGLRRCENIAIYLDVSGVL